MKKINIHSLIFTNILVFSISTLLQALPIFSNINKILMLSLLFLISLSFLKKKITKKNMFIIALSIITYINAYISTKSSVQFNVFFYFAFWILFLIYTNENWNNVIDTIRKKQKTISKVVVLFNIIVFISLFTSKSYVGGYYSPFNCGDHRYGSCCMLISALAYILSIERNNKKYLLWCILPFFGIIMGYARTYLAVYLAFIVCLYYINCRRKIVFYLSLIPVVILIYIIIYNSPMAVKMVDTTRDGYNGFLATFTSGRTMLWEKELLCYFKGGFFSKLFGFGFSYVYEISEKYFGIKLWAHNDFINVLLNFGIIGTYIYLYCILKFVNDKINFKSSISKIGFYFIWLFNAFFNMVYTYPVATLALPFIAFCFSDIGGKKDEK